MFAIFAMFVMLAMFAMLAMPGTFGTFPWALNLCVKFGEPLGSAFLTSTCLEEGEMNEWARWRPDAHHLAINQMSWCIAESHLCLLLILECHKAEPPRTAIGLHHHSICQHPKLSEMLLQVL